MVDVSATDELAAGPGDTFSRDGFTALDCEISAFDAKMAARYSRFAERTACGPHQSTAFLQAWQEATGAEVLIATIGLGGEPVTMIPLEVKTSAISREVVFPGGSHANGNFAPVRVPHGTDGASIAAALRQGLRRERPEIDVVALERMAPSLLGVVNPLLTVSSGASPDVALSVSIEDGFDALLERASGKRKRKKYRSQLRKYESAGGWRIVKPASTADVDRLLEAFHAMKATRFAQMGIPNVFAEPGCKAFMRSLYRDALTSSHPTFFLRGLEIGGVLRAVTGSSVVGRRHICDFSAISVDELTSSSPGDFLFFEMIREACDAGRTVFDFSVGDEYYKRLWCDTETWQFDLFTPLTGRGTAIATVSRSINAMKRALKSNPVLWSLAKRLRRGTIGREIATDHEDGK